MGFSFVKEQDSSRDDINKDNIENGLIPKEEAAATHLIWGEKIGLYTMSFCFVIFHLAFVNLAMNCPVLLLRPLLILPALAILFMNVLFVIRCRQIRKSIHLPRVLATVAKLREEEPQVAEFQAHKKAACWCFNLEGTRIIYVKFHENSAVELPRTPYTDEEAEGMYALFVEDDNPAEVGDTLEVVLLEDGKDPSRCLYIPHQENVLRGHLRNIIFGTVYVAASVIALYFALAGDLSSFFSLTRSEVDGILPGCTVDKYTSVSYFFLMVFPIPSFGLAVFFMRRRRMLAVAKAKSAAKKKFGAEDIPAESAGWKDAH